MPANHHRTRQDLIAAATALFASRGFDGVSLREITAKAKANIAAVNYHFGGKDQLIEAVLCTVFEPIANERTRRLDDLDAAATKGHRPTAAEVVRIIIEPMFGALDDPRRASAVLGLGARLMMEPQRALAVMAKYFRSTLERSHAALRLAVPHLDPATAFWRLHFLIGASLHVMHAGHSATVKPPLPVPSPLLTDDPLRMRRAVEELVAFAATGMAAPTAAAVTTAKPTGKKAITTTATRRRS